MLDILKIITSRYKIELDYKIAFADSEIQIFENNSADLNNQEKFLLFAFVKNEKWEIAFCDNTPFLTADNLEFLLEVLEILNERMI